jgi:hypothetical protein
MTLITIPDAAFKGTLLPGGWETRVPEAAWSMSDARVRDLTQMLRRHGASHAVAESEAKRRLDVFWRDAWRERIMKNAARWAHVYAKGSGGSLEGFDAALVARAWIPGMYAGRQPEGNMQMKELFAEMRRTLGER